MGSQWQTLDSQNMLASLKAAPERAEEHFQKGQAAPYTGNLPQQILVCGMGGSGSTGDFFQLLCREAPMPIQVNKNARLPAWVSAHTLVIAVSYSGNTAETLSCVEQALEKGAAVHLLSSGGKMQALATEKSLSLTPINGGLPPRVALFDMLFALCGSLCHLEPFAHLKTLEHSKAHLRQLADKWGTAPEQSYPWQLAQALSGQDIRLWGGLDGSDTIAVRWKNQLAENAKAESKASALPELNHNEIVALCYEQHPNIQLVHLSLSGAKGADAITAEHVTPHVGAVHAVTGEGDTFQQQALSLIYLADFVSVYLAYLQGVDPTPIVAIDALKNKMKAVHHDT